MEQRGFVFQTENLLSPDDAVATFLARVTLAPPGIERVPLDRAHGRILAEPVNADSDYPNASRSAMDGFAVRAADIPGSLKIAGDIAMGMAWTQALAPGTALRIPTGGVLPDGADAVVPVEDTVLDGSSVIVQSGLNPGENINERACDMRMGERVLDAGTRITAPHAGLFATLGIVDVPVFRRPRIAVISSGDELVSPDAVPQPGQIRDSNRFAIAATLRALGADAVHIPSVSDEPGALEGALQTALANADAAVLTGGSSVGERDRTPSAIAGLGAPGVIVHGLRVKPGKPTVLAAVGRQPIIGLPGNPTSAVVILQAVVRPILSAMCGAHDRVDSVEARLSATAFSRPGWTWYVPVSLKNEGGAWVAHPLPLRSSTVSIIARSDGYITLPEDVEAYPAGTRVPVTRFI
jgi:molybdenum cofactor synthesis domain-containing protein